MTSPRQARSFIFPWAPRYKRPVLPDQGIMSMSPNIPHPCVKEAASTPPLPEGTALDGEALRVPVLSHTPRRKACPRGGEEGMRWAAGTRSRHWQGRSKVWDWAQSRRCPDLQDSVDSALIQNVSSARKGGLETGVTFRELIKDPGEQSHSRHIWKLIQLTCL